MPCKTVAILITTLVAFGPGTHALAQTAPPPIIYSLDYARPGDSITSITSFPSSISASGLSHGSDGVTTGTVSLTAQNSRGILRNSISGTGAGYSGFVQTGYYSGFASTCGIAPCGGWYATFSLSYDFTSIVQQVDPGGNSLIQAYAGIFASSSGSQYHPARHQYSENGFDIQKSCNQAGVCTGSTQVLQSLSYTSDLLTGVSFDQNALAGTMSFKILIFPYEHYSIAPDVFLAVSGNASTSFIDSTHSLHWLGLTGLTDLDGNALDPANILSDADFDITSPVPEVSSLWMGLAGLLTLPVLVRRRVGAD